MTDTVDSVAPEKVVVQCAACEGKFRLSTKHAGKTIKCPKCEAPMAIPVLEMTAATAAAAAAATTTSSTGYDAGEDDAEDYSLGTTQMLVKPPPPSRAVVAAPPPPSSGGYNAGDDDDFGATAAPPSEPDVVKVGGIKSGDPLVARPKEKPFDNALHNRSGTGIVVKDTNRRVANSKTATIKKGDLRTAGLLRGKNPNLPLLIGTIAAAVVGLIAVIAILLSGTSTPIPDPAPVAGDPGNSARPADDAPLTDEKIANFIERFNSDVDAARTVDDKSNAVQRWARDMRQHPRMEDAWRQRFIVVLDLFRGEVAARRYDDEQRAKALCGIASWARDCGRDDKAKEIFEEVLREFPDHREAKFGLGWKEYKLPNDELTQAWDIEGLLDPLDEFKNKLLSPADYARAMALQEQVFTEAKARWELWQERPFEKMAFQAQKNLAKNRFFSSFEYETIVAEPFVVLLTNGTAGGRGTISEARKREREAQLKAVWEEWKKLVPRWNLKSTKPDTLENPQPFVWVSFSSQADYQVYIREMAKDLPPGARAYYDPKIETVIFWESSDPGDMRTVIHETIHQLMHRFSNRAPSGYGNHCFTEGFPEFFAGFRQNGNDVQFFQLINPGRAEEIQRFTTNFNGKLRPFSLMSDEGDWVIWDAPMLMCTPNMGWVQLISRNYAHFFSRTPYAMRPDIRQNLGNAQVGEILFHSSFYSFAWAFTYWLNENYPREYERFGRMLMNEGREGNAQTWLEAFNIQPIQPIPELLTSAQQALPSLQRQVEILRRTPAIQKMNRDFLAWLYRTFPPTRDMGTADLNRSNPNAGNNNTPSGNNRIPADVREALKQAATQAVRGNRQAAQELNTIMGRLLQAGITADEINEVLGEVGLVFDPSTGQIRGR